MRHLLECKTYLTVREAAELAKCTPAHLRKQIGKGYLKAWLLSSEWRINPSDLAVFVEERMNR